MARLNSRTLSSRSRPNQAQRVQPAREAAASMQATIDALYQQASRAAADRQNDIESITDDSLRRSLRGS